MSQTGYTMRQMLRRDLPELLEIERAAVSKPGLDLPWGQPDFETLREATDKRLFVLEREYQGSRLFTDVVGYIAYDIRESAFRIRRIVVAPDLQCRGLGRSMLDWLARKLTEDRRRLSLIVSECNVGACLFLRASGLKAVNVLRDHFAPGEDGYVFHYQAHFAELAPCDR